MDMHTDTTRTDTGTPTDTDIHTDTDMHTGNRVMEKADVLCGAVTHTLGPKSAAPPGVRPSAGEG